MELTLVLSVETVKEALGGYLTRSVVKGDATVVELRRGKKGYLVRAKVEDSPREEMEDSPREKVEALLDKQMRPAKQPGMTFLMEKEVEDAEEGA